MGHLYEHKVVPILRGPERTRAEDPEILERDKITAAASRLAVHMNEATKQHAGTY